MLDKKVAIVTSNYVKRSLSSALEIQRKLEERGFSVHFKLWPGEKVPAHIKRYSKSWRLPK